MPIRRYKPTSPGRRFMSVSTFEEVTRSEPEKSLLAPLSKKGGRNANGRITTRHQGGGHKRRYRIIDFKRKTDGVPAKGAAALPSMGSGAGVNAGSSSLMSGGSDVASALDGLKSQLSTLEDELSVDKKTRQQHQDHTQSMNKALTALSSTVTSMRGALDKLMSRVTAKKGSQPILNGYKLLEVVGKQAVFEDMGTGEAAVLRANGTLGQLTVYQVTGGQVVTNFGVASVAGAG